jgi:hypothetical protein
LGLVSLVLLILTGCRTTSRWAPVDLAEPGWKVRQGQAVWRSSRGGPELAGEILVATHPDGRWLVQLIKTPLPLLTVQANQRAWQIEIIPDQRIITGRGDPPTRLLWLHLAGALQGLRPLSPLRFEGAADSRWRLHNPATGEFIQGYLEP